MNWNFFYDDGEGKPYESINEWYKEIKHLIWPMVIIVIVIILALLLKGGKPH